jgi:hypothetical protein
LLLLGLVAFGCAFDASGVPTATDDATGFGSGDSGSDTTTTTSSSSSATVTTADSASASSEASTDPTAVDETSTAGATADETSTTAADTTDAMSTDDTSGTTGANGPICGNGMIESPETCETGDFGEFVCSDLGGEFTGTPTCAGCQLDTDACCWTTGVICVPGANDCCDGCGLDFVCD